MSNAISTIGTKFEYGESDSAMTEIEIKSFPDPVGTSEGLDKTTMKDTQYTSIPGLKGSNSAMDFTANYDAAAYAAIEALKGKTLFQKLTLNDGSTFSWKGRLEVSLADGAVNGIVDMTLHSFKEGDVSHAAAS